MAADKPKSSSKPTAKKAPKPKGPKFSARLVRSSDGAVIRVRTSHKYHANAYEAAAFLYENGDKPAEGEKRAPNELIDFAQRTDFAEAEKVAREYVDTAISKGFVPQEKGGKRTPTGWDAV